MYKNAIALLLLVLVASSKLAWALPNEDNNQIVVRLATETNLMPLYLAKFQNDNSGFDPSYLDKLEKVLHFDLGHNGMTSLVKQAADKEALANPSTGGSFSLSWKSLNIFYVITVRIQDKKVFAQMLSVNSNSAKKINGLPLTGDPSQDRSQIHKLADIIHKELFNSDGIASTRFLYTVKTKIQSENKWLSSVWEADYDGANAKKVTVDDSGYSITPLYMPAKPGYTSGSFFYVSYKNGQPKIYMASLKDGQARRLTTLKGNQLMPAISKQRDKVAFISDVTGNPDLFLQTFDPETGLTDKPRQIFTTNKATQGSPSFSPDGKRIAFVSDKDGSPRIYVMDIPNPGTPLKDIKPTLLSKHNKESTAPSWSPDGTKIAFCSLTKGVRQIWIYDFTKREERQITQGPGNKENPTWAPNSLHLLFNSTDANACELYLINLNQPVAKKISSGPGEKRFPNWQPRTSSNNS